MTLARLMTIVVVVAVNFATARALYIRDVELAAGLTLRAVASQFAVLQALRHRGRARSFWLGYLTIGLATMGTFSWGICVPDSRIFRLWLSYTEHADGVLSMIPSAPRFFGGGGVDLARVVMASIVWFLPQLLAAIMGGLLAILLNRILGKRVDHAQFGAAS
jgi:hypothetical protein